MISRNRAEYAYSQCGDTLSSTELLISLTATSTAVATVLHDGTFHAASNVSRRVSEC